LGILDARGSLGDGPRDFQYRRPLSSRPLPARTRAV